MYIVLQENEAYRSAIDLTGRLLTIMGQGVEKTDTPIKHSPYTLQVIGLIVLLLIQQSH